jgi:hypothetical protein
MFTHGEAVELLTTKGNAVMATMKMWKILNKSKLLLINERLLCLLEGFTLWLSVTIMNSMLGGLEPMVNVVMEIFKRLINLVL